MNNPLANHHCRRTFLERSSYGVGAAALGSLLNRQLLAGDNTTRDEVHVPRWEGVARSMLGQQRIKRVIHLCMAGGPSHLETLDYKPKLAEMDGQPMPKSYTEGKQIAQLQGQANNLKCLGPTHEFRKYGKSGQMISSIFPKSERSQMTFASFGRCRRSKLTTTRLIR